MSATTNYRCPMTTLARDESERVRTIVESVGIAAAERLFGLDRRTVYKAGRDAPVSRLTAEVIRGRLDRV